MGIESVQWSDNTERVYVLIKDGITRFVPLDPLNMNNIDIQQWLEEDGNEVKDAEPLPILVPSVISDRQFYQQLAIQGTITQDEALAAVMTGTLPESIAILIEELPANQRFAAKMMLSGATQFERHNPMTEVLGQLEGWSPSQIDDLYVAAAKL